MKSTSQFLFRTTFLLVGLAVLAMYFVWIWPGFKSDEFTRAGKSAEMAPCPESGMPEDQCPRHGRPVLANDPKSQPSERSVF